MPWARASELDRVIWCPGSKILPATRLVSDGVKKAGAWGTFVHYWKETGELLTSSDYYESFKKTFDKKWEIIGNPELRDELWPPEGQHETAYAFDCETLSTTSFNEIGADRWKESHGVSWVTGSCDYTGTIDGLTWVDDLKTGALFNTSPDRSFQLYFYAMCASICRWGDLQDTVVSVTHWPKYPLHILPNRTFGFLSARRLKKFQTLLVDTYGRWREKIDVVEKLRVGDYCSYCPAGLVCPMER